MKPQFGVQQTFTGQLLCWCEPGTGIESPDLLCHLGTWNPSMLSVPMSMHLLFQVVLKVTLAMKL